MATQTIQEPKYKTCTANCLAYKHPGDYGCEKGNFVFRPPLGKRCTFSLLEGELEKTPVQSQPSCKEERITAPDVDSPFVQTMTAITQSSPKSTEPKKPKAWETSKSKIPRTRCNV